MSISCFVNCVVLLTLCACFFLGDPGCGGTFTDSEGVIISPNWPNNYNHNRQCIYLIRLPEGGQVALNFTHMDLESHSGCAFDYVEVRPIYVSQTNILSLLFSEFYMWKEISPYLTNAVIFFRHHFEKMIDSHD